MSKLRIFISSTYYDLKHIRNNIETFIEDMGYEPILFESGDIPFHHDLTLDKSCYKAIEEAHMQIMIIGGRYGSPDNTENENKRKKIKEDKMYEFYNSITRQEFLTASEKGIPIYFFVESNVLSEYDTYSKNRENKTIAYAHVDSINIFKLLDDIYNLKTGNYIKPFDRFGDISKWLKEQWAGLFADFIENSKSKIELKNLNSRINELGSITSTLKEYSEALMRKIQPENFENIIDKEEKRIIEERATRLKEEAMIRHLQDKYSINPNSLTVYNSLINSANINDFLIKIGMKNSDIADFLSEFREAADRDYKMFIDMYLRR